MRRRVVWSERARSELLDIVRYIARDSAGAAERVLSRIEEAATRLADAAIGHPGRVSNTFERVLSNLPYVLAYEIVGAPTGDETIVIPHVMHGARYWPPGEWPAD